MILENVKQGSARRVAHKGAVAGFSFVMIGLTGCPFTVLLSAAQSLNIF